ncbi:MAG: N-acetylneuraminate synthase family protein [Treponema sp.]|jgi:sialic acid synthase SpsE|nr:N-acetylneuraminate synthase family protein [Treponema sp.]
MMNKKPFIIAELGTSHGGDPLKASELIHAAAEAGADCVKCQIIYADEILHPKTGMVKLPGGDIPLYETFKGLEQKPVFYEKMKESAEALGLLFLATPFGLKSAAELRALNPQAVKIASPELNYTALLRETASWGIDMFLSAGVSTLGDIEEALETVRSARNSPQNPAANGRNAGICLLHCVTAYPAPEEEYKLRLLPHLGGIFSILVGISDHSLDPVLVPVLGTALGAAAVEKHLCLSRSDPGLDDKIALEFGDFARMVRVVRESASLERGEVIARMEDQYGKERVEAVLGDGSKELAPSERANYGRTNRSIHAVRDIAGDEILQRGMFAVLRTEKQLKPGLKPCWEEKIIGKRVKRAIPAGEGITLDDIW